MSTFICILWSGYRAPFLARPGYEILNLTVSNLTLFRVFKYLLAMCAKKFQSCLTLCNPMDCSPPGSSVRGILQARTLEWVAISFSRELTDSGIEPMSLMSPALAGGFFSTSATWEAQMPPWVSPIIPGSDNKVPFTWHINHTKASFVSSKSSKWTVSVMSDYLWLHGL